EFRNDARNLALFVWFGAGGETPESAEADQQHLFAQLTQYAIERDYISLSDAPNWKPTPVAEHLAVLRRVLAHKLQIQEILSLLPPLASDESLRRSFDEEFVRSDAYREFLARYDGNIDADTLPSDVLGELVITTLGLFNRADRLIVRLQIPRQPFAT